MSTCSRSSDDGCHEPPQSRPTYHHGDLRQALLDAGIALARDGGPEAVVLREATRRAGVVPNAAYRHFASRHSLLQAVRAAALAALAVAMEKEMARSRDGCFARRPACDRHRLSAVRPHRAWAVPHRVLRPRRSGVSHNTAMAGKSGLNPFQLLGVALDRMVDAGVLPRSDRPGAEYLAWSAVHGLAMLALEGPLRRLTARSGARGRAAPAGYGRAGHLEHHQGD